MIYKLLIKIYYKIFRLKKDDLTSRAAQEIMGNHLVYALLAVFTLGFVSVGLFNQNKAMAASSELSQTVMASLIQTDSEFLLPQEELVEEVMGIESLLAIGHEKYQDDPATLDKTNDWAAVNSNSDDISLFDENGDLVFKPVGNGNNQSNGSGDTNQPQRTEIVKYEVQNGDTVSSIARRFGISVNTILWANDLGAYSLIRPGDSLTILPYSGILYTVKSGDNLSRISGLYSIEIDKITSANNLDDGLKAGQKIILPGAVRLAQAVATKKPATSYTGISAIRDFIQAPAAKTSGSKMAWPTVGSRITQYFSWRHTGVDIANKVGTPLYAADSGVVEIAAGGYNGGYGNTIVINHGGGIKTRYGHASKLFVKAGDQVEKGENIAAMGSTGRSTGSHLHFEVLVNGARKNPLNYVR